MRPTRTGLAVALLRAAPLLLFIVAVLAFGLRAPRFLTVDNAFNILIQSSGIAIVATGMTFVLLTGGIDLSVGSIMFLGAIAAGKLTLGGWPPWLAMAIVPLIGVACGKINALFITRLRMTPFIVTLATLFIGRGLGLYITQTRAMNLPEAFLSIGSMRVFGIPLLILLMAAELLVAQGILSWTSLGRQIYAVGNDAETAQKAGIPVRRVLAFAYMVSGFCAAVGGLVLVAQLAAVSPSLGERWEFEAIAAAVLGGTSLFGGKGRVLPGTLFGAVLIQTISNGLNIINANPYIYPVVMGMVIFIAVALDSFRNVHLRGLKQRTIRIPD